VPQFGQETRLRLAGPVGSSDFPQASQFPGDLGSSVSVSAAFRADEDVAGMAGGSGDAVAGKQVDPGPAIRAGERLDPEEIFHRRVGPAADFAAGSVQMADFPGEMVPERLGRRPIRGQVQPFQFLLHHPERHGVDVEAGHVATEPVGFQQGRSAAHEGIGHPPVGKGVASVEFLPKIAVAEFGQQ
jgi:hypothetical protein